MADVAILDAGLELFAEGGLEAASIEQIARRAGVTRATVYRRWRRKEDLLVRAFGRMREQAESPAGDWEKLPLRQVLEWLVKNAPKRLADPFYRRLTAQAISAATAAPELMEAYWDAYLKPRREGFRRLLAIARDQGRLARDIDLDMVQDMLGGALIHYLLIEPGERSEREVRAYLRRVLRALGLME